MPKLKAVKHLSRFDPDIIHSIADKLYNKASNTVAAYTIISMTVGLTLAFAAESGSTEAEYSVYTFLFFALIFAAIGFSLGQSKALAFKVEAQKLLLDLQIEKNTRKEDQQ